LNMFWELRDQGFLGKGKAAAEPAKASSAPEES
jgi:hypothetical protein